MGNTQSTSEGESTLTMCCSRRRNKEHKGQGQRQDRMENSAPNQRGGEGIEERQPLVDRTENNGSVPHFPFENLVFEGGGNKCLAFVGCLEYLEQIGAMKQIHRVGGTSGGAIIAALVAFGYSAQNIYDFWTEEDLQRTFLDHSCGYLSLLPNLFRNFGWNPGMEIYNWLGTKIGDKTFLDLYKERNGMELCVVVTNLNQMRIQYCHPKTTPDMMIKDAVRASMAIPGIFAASLLEKHGKTDMCVDGGMLCNYPVHCFDGWFLSMEPSNCFFNKVDTPYFMVDRSRFWRFNAKTLGFLLYEEREMEVIRPLLEARDGLPQPESPERETRLFKRKKPKSGIESNEQYDSLAGIKAVAAFFQVVKTFERQNPEYLSKSDLEKILIDDKLTQHRNHLFQGENDFDMLFKTKDKNKDGQISFCELMAHLQEEIFPKTGYLRKEVKGFTSYICVLKNTAVKHVNSLYIGKEDVDRTVGINTGYIGTEDYNLEDEDIKFILDRGRNATVAFFENNEKKRQHNLELNVATGPAVIEAEVFKSDMTDDTSDITEYDNTA